MYNDNGYTVCKHTCTHIHDSRNLSGYYRQSQMVCKQYILYDNRLKYKKSNEGGYRDDYEKQVEQEAVYLCTTVTGQ